MSKQGPKKTPGFIDWRSSKAWAIILRDLGPGGYLADKEHVLAKDLFIWYKTTMPEFEHVILQQFKDRLAGHRKQLKSKVFVDWRCCKARGIILRDLEPGGYMIEMDHVSAEDLFDWYKKMPEFEDVVFQQFKERLADHRKQSAPNREMARRDKEACRKDRGIFPRNTRNSRSELCFDVHPAKKLLQMDVAKGVHKRLTPSKLRRTRPAYMEFKYRIFKHRIYQEERRSKFLNYLEQKREKERPKSSLMRPKEDLQAHVQQKQSTPHGASRHG